MLPIWHRQRRLHRRVIDRCWNAPRAWSPGTERRSIRSSCAIDNGRLVARRPRNRLEGRTCRPSAHDNEAAFAQPADETIKGTEQWDFSHENSKPAPCTVEVSHRFESLHAHVRFDNGAVINPGDEVLVAGPPVMAAYGEVVIEERIATHHPRLAARTALDPADRRFRIHGAVRILLLRGGARYERPEHSHPPTPPPSKKALAARSSRPSFDSEAATDVAMQNTLLTPRFYTTDFDEMDAIDVDPRPRGMGQADRPDEGGPQQGPLQEERGLGPCRLGRDGAEAEGASSSTS